MKNSKLVQVLSTLSLEELSQFRKFLLSNTFNNNKLLLKLFQHLRKQLKARRPDFSKEHAFQVLFINKPYDNALMLHTMSYLFKLLGRFLAFNELYDNPHVEDLALCRAFGKRNIPKVYESVIQKTKTRIQKSPKRNIDYHLAVFELEMVDLSSKTMETRSSSINLQKTNDRLDIAYFAQKLRQCCLMIAHQNVINVEYNQGLINEVIREVEQNQLYDIPAIGIYYFSYKAQLESDNIAIFKKLQNQLISYAELFEPSELGHSYLLAINIGIKLLNKGEVHLMGEILELYKTGIETKVLFLNNRLSRYTYKNTITLAVRLKEFEWTASFINTYKELLDPRFMEESHSNGLAHLYYAQKKYEEAIKLLLVTAKSDDVFVNLDTKVLLTRIFYEQSEMVSLEAQISSFKAFIRRKNMISYQKPHYQNFISMVDKLIRLNPYDKAEKVKLRTEIEGLQPLPVKYWFLEQV